MAPKASVTSSGRPRGQLVELAHHVHAPDGDLLVVGRADDAAHAALRNVLAVDLPDHSPRRVPDVVDARPVFDRGACGRPAPSTTEGGRCAGFAVETSPFWFHATAAAVRSR